MREPAWVGHWPHQPNYQDEQWARYTWYEGFRCVRLKPKGIKFFNKSSYEIGLAYDALTQKYYVTKPFTGLTLGEGDTPEAALKNMYIRQRVKGEV